MIGCYPTDHSSPHPFKDWSSWSNTLTLTPTGQHTTLFTKTRPYYGTLCVSICEGVCVHFWPVVQFALHFIKKPTALCVHPVTLMLGPRHSVVCGFIRTPHTVHKLAGSNPKWDDWLPVTIVPMNKAPNFRLFQEVYLCNKRTTCSTVDTISVSYITNQYW